MTHYKGYVTKATYMNGLQLSHSELKEDSYKLV